MTLSEKEITHAAALLDRLSALSDLTASDVREIVAEELVSKSDRTLLLAYAEHLPS